MFPDWLNYVDKKGQASLVNILHELSHLQNKSDINFIVIGALPLLIRGYLKYKVCWDVDLLFKDKDTFKEFIGKPKSNVLKIVNYDDDLMINKDITSFHTTWAFNHTWHNVDYILKKGFFEFYTYDIRKFKPYTQKLKLNKDNVYIHLYIAHPWDIVADKIVSPRLKKELDLKADLSIDIRHIFAVYRQVKDDTQFWNHIFGKARYLQKEREFKKTFLNLLSHTNKLGYTDLEVSPFSLKMLEQ